MKRIRIGASLPALLFLAPLGGGFVLLHGCVPNADTSGLPPYDAGAVQADVTTILPEDAGPDATTDAVAEAAADTGPVETSINTATVVGVVLDYTQGAGKGVVPNATLSVINGPTVTAAADGTFTIPNLTPGRLQINVGHPVTSPFSGTSQVVYSTTQVVVTVTAGQTVTIEPVLHEGCAGLVQMGSASDAAVPTITLQNANCGARSAGNITGNYISVAFKSPSALINATSQTTYPSGTQSGLARVEMIPLAYPSNGETTDFTWGAGLPGQSTQIDTVGAAEVRVVDDATGLPLAINTTAGQTVTLTLPITPATTQGEITKGAYDPWYYDAVAGQWVLDTKGATLGTVAATKVGSGTLNTVSITAPHLTWWSVTSPVPVAQDGGTPTTDCFTGSLSANGAPAAGVWVHAIGTDWLGATTAVTDSTGAFCVEVKKASHVIVQAASVQASGAVYAIETAAEGPSNGTGGSCATNQGCTAIPPITLQAPILGCATGAFTGTLEVPDGSTPRALDVYVDVSASVIPAQTSAGILSSAYTGQVATSTGGTFCAPVAPGASVTLVDPNATSSINCPTPTPPSFTVPVTQAPAVCSAAGDCYDAGDIFYGCYGL